MNKGGRIDYANCVYFYFKADTREHRDLVFLGGGGGEGGVNMAGCLSQGSTPRSRKNFFLLVVVSLPYLLLLI